MTELSGLFDHVLEGFYKEYALPSGTSVVFQETREEFEGDVTLVVFPLVKALRKSPAAVGTLLSEYLKQHADFVVSTEVVQGFVNIVLTDKALLSVFSKQLLPGEDLEGNATESVLVEYSSPNTNKPLHLGHLRNGLLGNAVSNILKANGKHVEKVQIINDRGIHICKSMVAYSRLGKGETPDSAGEKGDHFVGKYYVLYEKEFQRERSELINSGMTEKQAEQEAPIYKEAVKTLKAWEKGVPEVLDLWKKMNAWVISGFQKTYNRLGFTFAKDYFESDTYLLGKKVVQEGLDKGVFIQKEDGSVWVDLTAEGLDEKILLRSDGTSVYITQDLGTAIERYSDFRFGAMFYTVADEQNYHFKVLFAILAKMGYQWATDLVHLSYGMVELPEGRMKSREGTVVDTDELMDQMYNEVLHSAKEREEFLSLPEDEKPKHIECIAQAALKYHILKVDAKKRTVFDPKESIALQGNTGPFIQYTRVRIRSLVDRVQVKDGTLNSERILEGVRPLILAVSKYRDVLKEAESTLNPSVLAQYLFSLSKEFNSFYQSTPLITLKDESDKLLSIQVSSYVGEVIEHGMSLLGIGMPTRM